MSPINLIVTSRYGYQVVHAAPARAIQKGLVVRLFVAHTSLCCMPQIGFAVRFLETMLYANNHIEKLEKEV